MKRPAVFALALLATLSASSSAGIRAPGIYEGVVIFDRWDACLLYNGIYVMYVSEAIKESLREQAGHAVRVDATEVSQPMNPGDGLIKALKLLGPAPKASPDWHYNTAGVALRTDAAFADGDAAKLRMVVKNAGEENLVLLSEQLAPTLLKKIAEPNALRSMLPTDGPSIAVVTRQGMWIGDDGPRSHCKGVNAGIPYEWSCRPLQQRLLIHPGDQVTIDFDFTLPPGEYDFMVGYYGQHRGGPTVASNLTAFDVDDKGRATRVTVQARGQAE